MTKFATTSLHPPSRPVDGAQRTSGSRLNADSAQLHRLPLSIETNWKRSSRPKWGLDGLTIKKGIVNWGLRERMPTMADSGREGILSPLVDQASLRATFRRRRDPFVYKKISSDEERGHLDEGWLVHKSTRSHTWMKKSKSPDTRLEDRIWCLFFQMGYPVLSGEKFRIQYKQSDGTDGLKKTMKRS
jgi:hypothetical protein